MFSLGAMIEALVAVLLGITIAYCVTLNRRLKGLTADESALRATIGELLSASQTAERAIAGLKAAASACDESLGGRLIEAGRLNETLAARIDSAKEAIRQIGRITDAVRGRDEPAPQSAPRAAVSAGIGSAAEQSARRLAELRRARQPSEAA